ncbi:uncharacterized protein A1O9_02241 [Exophiala aquamarina CBS 119918]|uniref:Transcription factor domain-containing protein n=1 Tax=Exophiala aquamarina CBS 119918 TaxID=1182545 RepID=A0A072PYJ2_9EURO|nr:uncharacterized protein A1O9_02241 [Exophiala aquamarina CBS 119918]KEF60680.1 hypothetical protein A1O9_02241 [Exophiala aquamarina CBS 119918]
MEVDAGANAGDGCLRDLGEQDQGEILPTCQEDQTVKDGNSIEQHPPFILSIGQPEFLTPDQFDFRERAEATHVDIDVGSPNVQNPDASGSREHYQQNEAYPSKSSSDFNPATGQHAHLIDKLTASPSFGEVHDNLADLSNVDLEVLNYLASNPSNLDLLASSPWAYNQTGITSQAFSPGIPGSVVASSPDMYSTYYPDHTYKELHSQLHNHMVKTARNKALTRRGSIESVQHRDTPGSPPLFLGHASTQGATSNSSAARHAWQTLPIKQKRYVELWQNYLDEIAPWLDMFDSEKNFQTTVAIMAKDVDYLQFSILALSARQLERKNPSKTHTESLHLYQEAIKLIAVQLPSLNTEIIAACVLLCVLEMMSSSPRAWAKHLDGCAMLLEAADVNGVVGGVRQAIFWCFARMDVWGGFLGDTITKIPTNRWFISTDSMSSAISQFKGKSGSDNYANYAVFLCASVVNVVSNEASPWPRTAESDYSTFVSRWKALYEVLEGWYDDRPEDMRPLINLAPPQEEMDSPFNAILFSTPAGVNGNQLYHASMLLLLQDKPKEIRMPKSHKSTIWHARQLCGIALSNDNHGASINALQPLWIAGKFMSHRSEHVAILAALERLEKQTGWATAWRAQDLKEFWGVGESQI